MFCLCHTEIETGGGFETEGMGQTESSHGSSWRTAGETAG